MKYQFYQQENCKLGAAYDCPLAALSEGAGLHIRILDDRYRIVCCGDAQQAVMTWLAEDVLRSYVAGEAVRRRDPDSARYLLRIGRMLMHHDTDGARKKANEMLAHARNSYCQYCQRAIRAAMHAIQAHEHNADFRYDSACHDVIQSVANALLSDGRTEQDAAVQLRVHRRLSANLKDRLAVIAWDSPTGAADFLYAEVEPTPEIIAYLQSQPDVADALRKLIKLAKTFDGIPNLWWEWTDQQ